MFTKTCRRFLPAALFLPALLAFTTPLDEPSFSPEKGASLTKTFEMVTDLALDELSIIVDGQDMGAMLGTLDVSVRNESTITVSDVYGESSDGHPLKLERTFDVIDNSTAFDMASEMGDESQETGTESALEGQTVLFTWNEEEGDYDVSFKEEEGDEDLLEGLEEDMDFRAFLPDGDVTAGDTWTVDIKSLASLAMPGGRLGQKPEGAEDMDLQQFEEILGDGFKDLLEDLFAGECECEYKGMRETDGVKVAEIAITLEISSAVDLSEILLDIMDIAAEEAGGMMPDLNIDAADFNLDFEGEGLLLWNAEAGLPHSFEINGDAEIALDIAIEMEMEGEGQALEAAIEFSGTIAENMSVEG